VEALGRRVTDRSTVAEGGVRPRRDGCSCWGRARRANEGIGDHGGCAERAETDGAVVLVHGGSQSGNWRAERKGALGWGPWLEAELRERWFRHVAFLATGHALHRVGRCVPQV
jgi:hypothetical protein